MKNGLGNLAACNVSDLAAVVRNRLRLLLEMISPAASLTTTEQLASMFIFLRRQQQVSS
jgi:hypothetical protein